MKLLVSATAASIALSGAVMAASAPDSYAAVAPLVMRSLQGSVVRMGSLHGRPLYGVRLHAFVCSRSSVEADRTVPTSFRIAHYITPGRKLTNWGRPFRVVDNDLHWVVSLGETRGTCGYVDFEDVIPQDDYGSAESPLGVLGYSNKYRCYGIQLALRASLGSADQRTSAPISASRRTIIQCGLFHPG
jgi:hypothetical protein